MYRNNKYVLKIVVFIKCPATYIFKGNDKKHDVLV